MTRALHETVSNRPPPPCLEGWMFSIVFALRHAQLCRVGWVVRIVWLLGVRGFSPFSQKSFLSFQARAISLEPVRSAVLSVPSNNALVGVDEGWAWGGAPLAWRASRLLEYIILVGCPCFTGRPVSAGSGARGMDCSRGRPRVLGVLWWQQGDARCPPCRSLLLWTPGELRGGLENWNWSLAGRGCFR